MPCTVAGLQGDLSKTQSFFTFSPKVCCIVSNCYRTSAVRFARVSMQDSFCCLLHLSACKSVTRPQCTNQRQTLDVSANHHCEGGTMASSSSWPSTSLSCPPLAAPAIHLCLKPNLNSMGATVGTNMLPNLFATVSPNLSCRPRSVRFPYSVTCTYEFVPHHSWSIGERARLRFNPNRNLA
jgi:hypothetical protein